MRKTDNTNTAKRADGESWAFPLGGIILNTPPPMDLTNVSLGDNFPDKELMGLVMKDFTKRSNIDNYMSGFRIKLKYDK